MATGLMATRKKPPVPATKKPRREYREFQFVVVPVLLRYEGDAPPRPVQTDPRTLHGLDELRAFCDLFEQQLAEFNASDAD